MKRTRTKSGVYFIKNLVNGKVYIGSSFNIFNRLKCHKKALEGNRHCNKKLQHAWNKYGEDNFQSIFFEKVIDLESIVPKEQYWMDYMDSYKNGYNLCPKAGSPMKDKKHSDAAKRKISIASAARIVSPETRKKIGDIHRGKIMSPEARKKMSIAKKDKCQKEEHKRKRREANLGKKHSEKSKKKMSDTWKELFNNGYVSPMKGRHHSPETKEKIGRSNKGKHRTKKFKRNLSIKHKGKILSDDHKRKIGDGNRGKHRSEKQRREISKVHRVK